MSAIYGRCAINKDDLPAEDKREREQQLANVTGGFRIFDACYNHVGEGRTEKQESQNKQEHQSSPLVHLMLWDSVSVHSDWIVPAEEDNNGHESIPWEFNHNVRYHEHWP